MPFAKPWGIVSYIFNVIKPLCNKYVGSPLDVENNLFLG